MRVLVCGSRFWMNAVAIRSRLAVLPADAVVIHGGARGADRLAEAEAKARGLTVPCRLAALWPRGGAAPESQDVDGRAAGCGGGVP
mgnify:FL=1